MKEHYQTLGVAENASHDKIKLAYRRLANQHHPDKGGDQATFKNIAAAYEVIGDVNKRAEYDNQHSFGNNTGAHQFHDIFRSHFGGHSPFGDIFGRQQVHRNRDLNMNCQISFTDSFLGKQLEANYNLPTGKPQSIVIDVPAGIEHGATIQYQGLGDDSIPNMPRGNLNVTFIVEPDLIYKRVRNNIYCTVQVNPIEAMIGCKKQIKLPSGESISLDIRAGVETGVEYIKRGSGFTNIQTRQRGDFISVIEIKTPVIKNIDFINKLIKLNDEINNYNTGKQTW